MSIRDPLSSIQIQPAAQTMRPSTLRGGTSDIMQQEEVRLYVRLQRPIMCMPTSLKWGPNLHMEIYPLYMEHMTHGKTSLGRWLVWSKEIFFDDY